MSYQYLSESVRSYPRTLLRGVGQVMFQDSMYTGLIFLIGIFWGAYEEHIPIVAWGCLVGVMTSTLTGYVLRLPDRNAAQGLWGFNGALVGCAFPTFLGNTPWMWIGLMICAAMTTWVQCGMDRGLGKFGVSSLTAPFVLCTYFFLLAARLFKGMSPIHMGTPELPDGHHADMVLSVSHLAEYWLKGISQVFLIDSWITGVCFLVALAVNNVRAAVWAAVGSAVALAVAMLWGGPGADIAGGLYGFSAVLTAIALGATFGNTSWQASLWTLIGIICTVFVQAAMNAFFSPMGLPTLTGPFCLTTWLFLFPEFKFFQKAS